MAPSLSGVQQTLERSTLRTLLMLPPRVQRVLAGKPVRLDGQTLDVEAQLTIRLQKLARKPESFEVPVDDARRDMDQQAGYVGSGLPIGSVSPLTVAGADGPVPARLYRSTGGGARGLLVYFHGGGMIYGGLDSHDGVCRFLAERAGVVVVSVDYRLGPEHPHPAGAADCAAAYQDLVSRADELGVDAARIAVGGDSAGGYFAAWAALEAARAGVPCAWQMLIYPVTDHVTQTRSRDLFSEGFYLTKGFMDFASASYFGDYDLALPDASVLNTTEIPAGLAPAFVATAGFDPLRDEGEAYAALLAGHGVEVETERFPGMIHGFFNFVAVGRTARAANASIAARLKDRIG